MARRRVAGQVTRVRSGDPEAERARLTLHNEVLDCSGVPADRRDDEPDHPEVRVTPNHWTYPGVHDGDLIGEQRSEPIPVVGVLCGRDGGDQLSRVHPPTVPEVEPDVQRTQRLFGMLS